MNFFEIGETSVFREEDTMYSVKEYSGGAFIQFTDENENVYSNGEVYFDFDEAFRICKQLRAGKYPRAVVVNLRGDEINPLPT